MGEQPNVRISVDASRESAGCCGLVARGLGVVVLIGMLAVLGFTLVGWPPDRWQGVGEAAAHPLALVTDPRQLLTLYIGTEQGHVLTSQDGGQQWRQERYGLPKNTPVSALALVPGGARLLAGTSKGAYLSSDGGETWQSAGMGIPPQTIVDAVAAVPDGALLAGTASDGIYRMPSGGSAWVSASEGLPPRSDIYAVLPLSEKGRVLAARISGGIYLSADGGVTWSPSRQGLPADASLNVFALLLLPGEHGGLSTVLAGTSRGLYRSRDAGTTWQMSSAGIGTIRVISLAQDPVTPLRAIAGTDIGVFASYNGGTTWHPLGFGLPAEQHVGAVGVLHPAGHEPITFASVGRLYRYPGQWLLAAEPWRGLGIGALIMLALTFTVFVVWQARALLQ
jgi:photosystem II stability/assembly factor-like uncharacterized protein